MYTQGLSKKVNRELKRLSCSDDLGEAKCFEKAKDCITI